MAKQHGPAQGDGLVLVCPGLPWLYPHKVLHPRNPSVQGKPAQLVILLLDHPSGKGSVVSVFFAVCVFGVFVVLFLQNFLEH